MHVFLTVVSINVRTLCFFTEQLTVNYYNGHRYLSLRASMPMTTVAYIIQSYTMANHELFYLFFFICTVKIKPPWFHLVPHLTINTDIRNARNLFLKKIQSREATTIALNKICKVLTSSIICYMYLTCFTYLLSIMVVFLLVKVTFTSP